MFGHVSSDQGSTTGLTDTQVSTFVEAWTALGAAPVHGPHTPAVRRLVADPEVDTHKDTHTQVEDLNPDKSPTKFWYCGSNNGVFFCFCFFDGSIKI